MEMIERICRAKAAKHYAKRFHKPEADEHVQANVEGNWTVYIADVRETIEAMREPTEAMINSPMARCYNDGPYAVKEVGRIYSAMIDAALSSKDG